MAFKSSVMKCHSAVDSSGSTLTALGMGTSSCVPAGALTARSVLPREIRSGFKQKQLELE